MPKLNENYLNLKESYLFAEINQLSCLQNDDAFFTAGAFLRQQSKEIKRLKKLEKR